MGTPTPQFVRLCPCCQTERPVGELFCEHMVAGQLCHWDLATEPIYFSGAGPQLPADCEASTPQPVAQTWACLNGHPLGAAGQRCAVCEANDATQELAIFLGASKDDNDHFLLLKYGNRHGLIAGANGTSKAVTLQTIAEGFASYGVPVFMADFNGDFAGISQIGGDNPWIVERAKQLQIDSFAGRPFPVVFWDLFGEKGHPVRTTVSEFGPVLMAYLLQLNATQEGVLNIVFKIADEQGLLLLDFKDLTALLQWCGENAGQLTTQYGNVSKASVGAIQRALLVLEQQGGEHFFGEPALDLHDMFRRDSNNVGYINVLAADRLMQNPRLYATFLLWLLSELFEIMPEVGDLDRPKFVFFFDEAHLLFDDAPKALIEKIEQVVRLIGSKGVGVYFVTQNLLDVPDTVLGQLSNRVQHALRTSTPKDRKAVKTAAQTFRANDSIDASKAILDLGVGEALVSFLDTRGGPGPVERIFVAPPQSRLGGITDKERQAVASFSPVAGKYDSIVDRDSAFEVLMGRVSAGSVPQTQTTSRRTPLDPLERPAGGQYPPVGESVKAALRREALRQVLGSGRKGGSGLLGSFVRGLLGSLVK